MCFFLCCSFGENIYFEYKFLSFVGVKKPINSELWHACAGPLVTLPQVGSLVYYFPQGHSEQVRFYSRSRIRSFYIDSKSMKSAKFERN